MLTCDAGGLTRVRIRAWLGGNAPAFIDLYQEKNNAWGLLTKNPSAADELDYKIPPQGGLAELCIYVANEDKGGQAQPLYLEISQDGEILPISDGSGTLNGNGPYSDLKLSPDAPLNKWKSYYFNVRFS